MVHFRHEINIQVTQTSPQTITVNPTQLVNIEANGNGTITITFATTVPQPLSQFAVSNNQVKIPVVGEVQLRLLGVTNISASGNLNINVQEQAQGILEIPAQIQTKLPQVQNVISVQVTNNTIQNVTVDGQPIPPTNIIHVGFEPITFVGYNVSFVVQDYDPITNLPAGSPLQVNLQGSSSVEAEYPTGSTVLASRTGFIVISNITGSGYFHIFRVKPAVLSS